MRYIQTEHQPGWRIPGAAILSATLTGCSTGIDGHWSVTHMSGQAVPNGSSINIEVWPSNTRGIAPTRIPPFSGTISFWTDKAVLDISEEGSAKIAIEYGYANSTAPGTKRKSAAMRTREEPFKGLGDQAR